MPDPVDHRLLALLAEVGRIPVHELAARAGLDVRDVALRLTAMGAAGLPVTTVAEVDQARLRQVLAATAPSPGTPGGWVGTPLYTPGPYGGYLGVRVIEVVDPADHLVASDTYRVPDGERAVLVTVELYNHGPAPLEPAASQQLYLITQDGAAVSAAVPPATHPLPPGVVLPGQLVRGSVTYLISGPRPVTAVRWHSATAGWGLPGGTLTWHRP